MTWDLGFRKIAFEYDSKALVATLTSGKKFFTYLIQLGKLLNLSWEVEVVDVYKEGNACAH